MMALPARAAALRLAIGLSTILSAACFESAFPLDPAPQTDIDARLPGAWHCIGPDAGDRDMTLTIARTRDRVYALTFQEFGQEAADRYEAHASMVAGAPLVNVRSLNPSEKPWAFVRYTLLRPKVLQLQIVDEKALKNVTAPPAAVRQAIERQIKDPALFLDACTCVRMNDAR